MPKSVERRIAEIEKKLAVVDQPLRFMELADPEGGPPIVVPADAHTHAVIVAEVERGSSSARRR